MDVDAPAPDAAPAATGALHDLAADAALARLSATPAGLSSEEAALRLALHGANRLPEPAGKTRLGVFLSQFRSPFIYLLLVAAAVSLALGQFADAVFIAIVLLVDAGVGSWQEWRAETRSRALRALIKGRATVRRDGRLLRLPAEALVPGDIVQVESGERVGADLRLLQACNLDVDESLLTGESEAVTKCADIVVAATAPLGDRPNVLHAGTTVRTGRGVAVVAATGSGTVIGQLAATLRRPESPPPLVQRMARFTRHVAAAVLVVIAGIGAVELARGAALGDFVLLAVALAVAAIPEGLPVAMTVALSIATYRMGRRNVIVRHLPAVEGLGACTLIATDKTGTLTQNRLTVERLWLPACGDTVPDAAVAHELLVAAARASEDAADEGEGAIGDAVDLAFAAAGRAHGALGHDDDMRLIGRVPYEPEQRFAAAFFQADGEGFIACVKGAPETIAGMCADADAGAAARAAAERLSADGYRVIAVASGRVRQARAAGLRELTLLGLAGLIDPLRPRARESVLAAQRAGIGVRMITGDHPLTALAIARQIGLAQERGEVAAGAELACLDGLGFDAAVRQARVFARIEPLQKLAIVESLRRQGEVVAVTGDGVNDAPALHVADIGVAMGASGTDVAREAADLILADDNFASIVAGIEEGRIAYDNLRKVIALLISTGAAEILLVLLSTLAGLPPPLSAVQLLWLNLITNGIQDVALAFERGEADVLERVPRAARAPIFDRRMIEQVAVGGASIGLTAFAFYAAALAGGMEHAAAQGAVLWLLVWCENAHCFNSRSETRSVFRVPLRNNLFLLAAVAGTQLLQIAVLAVPSLRELLSLNALTVADGLRLAGASVLVLGAMEAFKWLRRRP